LSTVELLLIELVKELNDCLSRFEAATTFTAAFMHEVFSLILACLDFSDPVDPEALFSLGRFEEAVLASCSPLL
jgi:hypothetical protein